MTGRLYDSEQIVGYFVITALYGMQTRSSDENYKNVSSRDLKICTESTM